MREIRISEYYDLFDVRYYLSTSSGSMVKTEDLPTAIQPTQTTNTFSGFNNGLSIGQSSQYQEIVGQHKASQGITNISVDDDGSIWCYPPNVSVPYWTRIIFRNYDYQVQPKDDFKYKGVVDTYLNKVNYLYPKYVTEDAELKPTTTDAITTDQYIVDYKDVPLFLKYDEYRSRSKVVFSSVDKTRNPDIEHRFGYQHGQMSPIKLNLSLSCNNPIYDSNYQYNFNLNRTDINKLLSKCYWSIEWICEPENGN